MNKKNILIITELSFLSSMKGNNNRLRSIYNYLVKHYNVDIFFLNNDEKIIADNIYYYDSFSDEKCNELLLKDKLKKSFDSFISTRKNKYDYAIISYIWNAYIVQDHDCSFKTIVDTNDCLSARTESFKNQGLKYRNPYTIEEEKEALKSFDYIMAITNEEKKLFESMGFNNIFVSKYYCEKPINKINKLGFIASNNLSAFESLKWFYNNVFKKIDNDYYLYICGDIARATETKRLFLNKKNVRLYSPIYDLSDYYSMIDITINPVIAGSGLKIKNVESIIYGKPCITSSLGLSGLKDEYFKEAILRADTPLEYIEKINYLSKVENYLYIKNNIGIYEHLYYSENKTYKELKNVIN